VVKAGDVVKVKVLEVDLPRKRIALTMRLDDPLPAAGAERAPRENRVRADKPSASAAKESTTVANNAFADAFTRARRS
jgi:uncharacterized protein